MSSAWRGHRRSGPVAASAGASVRDPLRGTELQMLCAMAGLPVLPASANNHSRLHRYLFAAVHSYALANPSIFPADGSTPKQVWWENDTHTPPQMTEERQEAIARAVRAATQEVAIDAPPGYMHMNPTSPSQAPPTAGSLSPAARVVPDSAPINSLSLHLSNSSDPQPNSAPPESPTQSVSNDCPNPACP